MSFILGLTGSIGMGKSTTAQFFREAGVPIWDADAAVHELYAPGGAAVEKIAQMRPEAKVNGGIDRPTLKVWMAEDSDALSQIESVVHPLVAADRAVFIAENKHKPLILLDIPLLFETGSTDQVDAVLVVSAEADEQRARVMARPGMTEEMFQTILSRQIPDAEKRARADYVIETKSLEQTRVEVLALIEKLTGETHA